jgi:hypothetical protein
MMIAPDKQKEIARATAAAAQRPAVVRVIKGVMDRPEYELKASSTYIGKSERVQIKIKGKGLFGSAPESAILIARRLEGYFIVPSRSCCQAQRLPGREATSEPAT